jgi:hypothetical protein
MVALMLSESNLVLGAVRGFSWPAEAGAWHFFVEKMPAAAREKVAGCHWCVGGRSKR